MPKRHNFIEYNQSKDLLVTQEQTTPVENDQ